MTGRHDAAAEIFAGARKALEAKDVVVMNGSRSMK
jgi:hypothetical protein